MKNKVILLSFIISLNLFGWKKNGVRLTYGQDETDAQVIAPEGKDYFYVVWSEIPKDYRRVVAGKFDVKTGKPLWSSPFIVADTGHNQNDPQAVATPCGDLIIAFRANFSLEGGEWSVYATRITPKKEWRWDKKWIKLSSVEVKQRYPRLCLSPDGGCWVVWKDYRDSEIRINVYIAKVSADGTVEWERPISNVKSTRWNPAIIPSGNGAIVLWGGKEFDTLGVYGNRILNDKFLWGERGKLILPSSSSFAYSSSPWPFPYAVSDLKGGAYVFPEAYWEKGLQHVDSLGNLSFDSILPYRQLRSLYFTVTQKHNLIGCYSITDDYARVIGIKVDTLGNSLWKDSLVLWESPIFDRHEPNCAVVSDYNDGCVVAINGQQVEKYEEDLIVIKIDSLGNQVIKPQIVCDAWGPAQNIIIIHEPKSKGYIVVWEDSRSGEKDIYAALLDSSLQVVGVEEEKSEKICFFSIPNISRFPLNVELNTANKNLVLRIYDVNGRKVREFSEKRCRIVWEGKDANGNLMPPGIYFVEVRDEAKVYREVRKVIIIK